jgi:hypothetical protein
VNSTRATVHEFALAHLGAAVTESEQSPPQQYHYATVRVGCIVRIATVLTTYLNWAHLAHGTVTITPLRIRRPHRISDWLTLSGHLIQDPLLLATLVCSHAGSCAMPCRVHVHAHIMPAHLIPTCP